MPDNAGVATSPSVELQVFLDQWDKDGVTIAESTVDDSNVLIAFADTNDDEIIQADETVYAQVAGEIRDIPLSGYDYLDSGTISGRCGFATFYELTLGEYTYRDTSFVVGIRGWREQDRHVAKRSCELNIEVTPGAFDGEEWFTLSSGTVNGAFDTSYLYTEGYRTPITFIFPLLGTWELLSNTYGDDGELAVLSRPDEWERPAEGTLPPRMRVGTWKVIFKKSGLRRHRKLSLKVPEG
jgi:hypothetical protein